MTHRSLAQVLSQLGLVDDDIDRVDHTAATTLVLTHDVGEVLVEYGHIIDKVV